MSDPIYLNFPVPMLQDAFINIREVMSNIMYYAGYVHTLKLEHGDDEKKMKSAGEYFGITWGSVNGSFREGRELFDSIPENTPKVGINKEVLFDFYKNHKTQDEIAVLLAFLALKSIIGDKPYIRTTNEFMIARMGGYASIKDMPDPLPDPLKKYNSRRMLDKIKFELQTGWNVKYYARYIKGFYVSIYNPSESEPDKSYTLDKLVLEAEKRRKSNLEKQLKNLTGEARLKALKTLGITDNEKAIQKFNELNK
jgi:hypothetical protein